MRPRLSAPLGAIVLFVVACGGGTAAAGSSSEVPDDLPPAQAAPVVEVLDNRFETPEVVVEAGETVTWEWHGRIVHDVSGDGFASDIQVEGTFTHTFDDPGTHPFRCTLHPGMEGVVYVVAG